MKIRLEQYGEGWAWEIDGTDFLGREGTQRYRTNREGEGLWHSQPGSLRDGETGEPILEWQQVLGTGQFSLVGTGRDAARGRIRRYFAEEYEA